MNEARLNAVPLNRVGLNTIGEIRSSAGGGGGGGDAPSYPNGVYIQHIDGKLYTADEWTAKGFANDVANGVAVVDDKAKFVISKQPLSSNYANTYYPYSGFFPSEAEARQDLNGVKNTTDIVEQTPAGIGSAAKSCFYYIFPNGNQGYLPSYGELYISSLWNNDIKEAMTLIGGAAQSGACWSSTYSEKGVAWVFLLFGTFGTTANATATKYGVRPFTTL